MSDTDNLKAYREIDSGKLYGNDKRSCRDALWIPLWVGMVIFILVLFGIKANIYLEDANFGWFGELLIKIFAVSAILGGAFALVWIGVMYLLMGKSVIVSLVLWVLMNIGFGVYLLTEDLLGNAIVNFIIAGLSAIWFILVRHKIPFAQTCVDISLKAFNRHKAVLLVSVFCTFINVGW